MSTNSNESVSRCHVLSISISTRVTASQPPSLWTPSVCYCTVGRDVNITKRGKLMKLNNTGNTM